MGKGKDLSDSVKSQIVASRQLGRSITETARLAGCSRSAVARVYRLWSAEGRTSSRRQGVGRPRLIDTRGLRRLSRLVQGNSTATVAQVAEDFNDGRGRSVSEHTVHRALLRLGLRSRSSAPVTALTPGHCLKRLQWAREHRAWSPQQWSKVAWSGESRFLLKREDGKMRVRRLNAHDLAQTRTVERRRADEGTVVLWGLFSWESLGGCVHVEDSLTHAAYLNIVADHVHSFMAAVYPDGGGLFQQDSTPCLSVRDWFEEHEEEFKVLTWPPNSSDLNPIQHLWGFLESQVQSAADPPGSVEELRDLLLASWYKITKEIFRGGVEAMAARITAVLGAAQEPSGPVDSAPSITDDCQIIKGETPNNQAEWLANYAFGLCQNRLLVAKDYQGNSDCGGKDDTQS